jgi:hypothetical protein
MGKGLWLGTILGAIIVFIWMMISWMFIPWHCMVMNKFSNEQSVSETILKTLKGMEYTSFRICATRLIWNNIAR